MHALVEETASPDFAESRSALSRLLFEGKSWSGHERNCLYLNLGKRGTPDFANASAVTGFDLLDDGRGLALTDWDADGDLDIWMTCRTAPQVRFLRNQSSGNHWLRLKLEGNGKTSNRDAVGARVVVTPHAGDAPIRRSVRAGGAFLSQSSKWIHVGLGSHENLAQVEIRWPDGTSQSFHDITASTSYVLKQGDDRLQRWVPAGTTTTTPTLVKADVAKFEAVQRSLLLFPVPLPPLSLQTMAGERLDLKHRDSECILVNLWASWCTPCLAELQAFAANHERLEAANVRVIALNVDGLDGKPVGSVDLEKLVERFERSDSLQFARGNKVSFRNLALITENLFTLRQQLSVPCSFLVDSSGHIAGVYAGKLDVDSLLADVDSIRLPAEQRLPRILPFSGKWNNPRFANLFDRIARQFYRAGAYEFAEHVFREGAKTWENDPLFQHDFGVTLQRRGKWRESADVLNKALGLTQDPNKLASIYAALGNSAARLGYEKPAEQAFHYAIERQPRHVLANRNLALLLAKRGDFEQALPLFSRVTELTPESAEAWNELALTQANANLTDEAFASYRRALELDPDHAATHNNLGFLFASQGRFEEAERHYRAALKADSALERARTNLQQLDKLRSAPKNP